MHWGQIHPASAFRPLAFSRSALFNLKKKIITKQKKIPKHSTTGPLFRPIRPTCRWFRFWSTSAWYQTEHGAIGLFSEVFGVDPLFSCLQYTRICAYNGFIFVFKGTAGQGDKAERNIWLPWFSVCKKSYNWSNLVTKVSPMLIQAPSRVLPLWKGTAFSCNQSINQSIRCHAVWRRRTFLFTTGGDFYKISEMSHFFFYLFLRVCTLRQMSTLKERG